MARLTALGRRRDDGRGERFVLAQAIGKINAVNRPITLAVLIPERRFGHAGDVAAHHDFDRERRAALADRYVGVGHGQNMIGDDILGRLKPERCELIEHLPLVRNQAEDAVKGGEPIGRHEDQTLILRVDITHLALGTFAHCVQVRGSQRVG